LDCDLLLFWLTYEGSLRLSQGFEVEVVDDAVMVHVVTVLSGDSAHPVSAGALHG